MSWARQRDLLYVRSLFRPADFGGNRYPWEVTRRMAARGHRVRVITPRLAGPLPCDTDIEMMTYPVSRRTPLETFVTNAVGSRVATERALRRGVPDAVFVSSYEVAYAHALVRPRNVPVIFIYHSHFRSDAVRTWRQAEGPKALFGLIAQAFMEHAERRVFAAADRVVAVSPFSRREIVHRMPTASSKVRLIPTGVETAAFRPADRDQARARLGLDSRDRVLLFVGRLASVKRVDRAIDALGLLRVEDPRYRLLVVGKGPEEPILRARTRTLGLDGAVRFEGFQDATALRDRNAAADLQLCTSEFENWSLALLEGLACGLPVVGVATGSISDLLRDVDERCIVAGDDPLSIAARVGELFSDPALLERIGHRSRDLATERYDWESVVDRLLSVVEEIT